MEKIGQDLVEEGQQLLPHSSNLTSQLMIIAGEAILAGRLLSLISLCDEKLDDPSYGAATKVLKPSYEVVIKYSKDKDLVDRAYFGLATLHLKGQLFEDMSIEDRYRVSKEQTVAIADELIEKVVDEQLYDKWTDQVREPFMKRRKRRVGN